MTDNRDAEESLSAIGQTPSPTRGQQRRQSRLILTVGGVVTIVAFWWVGGFRDSW